jgi:hypothetical protein
MPLGLWENRSQHWGSLKGCDPLGGIKVKEDEQSFSKYIFGKDWESYCKRMAFLRREVEEAEKLGKKDLALLKKKIKDFQREANDLRYAAGNLGYKNVIEEISKIKKELSSFKERVNKSLKRKNNPS